MARVHRFAPSILLLVAVSVVHADAVEPLRDKSSGRMFALRVAPGSTPAPAQGKAPAVAELRATADAFIAANRELIGLADPSRDLVATPVSTDKLGLSRVRYLQTHRGLDVLGGEVQVHMGRGGQVTYVKTKVARELPGETAPRVTQSDAEDTALEAAVGQEMDLGSLQIWRTRLLILPLGMVRNEAAEQTHLAWEVEVVDAATTGGSFSEAYYVDALDGGMLLQLSRIMHFDAVNRQIYDCAAQGQALCQLGVESATFPGYFHGRSEGQPARGPYPEYPGMEDYWGSTQVDTLYEMAERVHNWVSTTFGINGANGQGGLAIYPAAPSWLTRLIGHADTGAAGGVSCPGNASYGVTFGSIYLCRGMDVFDVIGHEYAHGIVYHSFHDPNGSPVGSTYYGQSGALDEGFADVFGEVFEWAMTGSTDWKNRTTPSFPPSRNLADPPALNRPQDGLPYPERFHDPYTYCGSADQGGVHHNSTIPSHAFYLIAEGGTHNGCTIAGQGMDVAIQIFFRGWRTYFSSNPTFNEAYADLIQASSDLYSPAVTAEVTKALQAVEMDQPGLCSGLPASNPPCSVVGVGDSPRSEATIRLLSQFPARGAVRFAYRVATAGRVEVRVHDLAGRLVARPVADDVAAGEHVAGWDGRIDGVRAAAGAYFLSVTLDGESLGARKLVLMR